MEILIDDYADMEKEKILEALNTLKLNPSQTIEMNTVHATAMQKARELVERNSKWVMNFFTLFEDESDLIGKLYEWYGIRTRSAIKRSIRKFN